MASSPHRRRSRRLRSAGNPRERTLPEDPAAIDARYGLEPLYEPGAGDGLESAAQGARFETVQCPYCGEGFETQLDLSAGSAEYIEDCQICCQPIEFCLQVDAAGQRIRLGMRRGD